MAEAPSQPGTPDAGLSGLQLIFEASFHPKRACWLTSEGWAGAEAAEAPIIGPRTLRPRANPYKLVS